MTEQPPEDAAALKLTLVTRRSSAYSGPSGRGTGWLTEATVFLGLDGCLAADLAQKITEVTELLVSHGFAAETLCIDVDQDRDLYLLGRRAANADEIEQAGVAYEAARRARRASLEAQIRALNEAAWSWRPDGDSSTLDPDSEGL